MKSIFPCIAVVAAAQAYAEPVAMEHVLVSVPLHKKIAETALPITVLNGDTLRRAATATLGDTLQATPGLANASFGPGVGQPVVRGQQGARVTVLQNGTSSADASNLSADHANAVEPLLADSIEVLRGPATLLYGGGAIGGVVNILDNRIPTTLPDAPGGVVAYRFDAASNRDVGVIRLDGGHGALAFHIDGLLRQWHELEIPGQAGRFEEDPDHARGQVPNTDGDNSSFTIGSSYHFDAGFVGLAVSHLDNEYGIPAGAHDEHEENESAVAEQEAGAEGEDGGIRLDVSQTRYDAALHWHEPVAALEVVRGFLTFTDYQHKEIESTGEIGTRFENDTFESRFELVHQPLGGLHGVFGLQAKHGEFSALGEEAFVPMTDSSELGLFLLEDYHSGDWTYEAGLRFDRVERDPASAAATGQDFSSFSVSASVLWEINPRWQAGLALSRAERAPAAEELFSNIENSTAQDWVVHGATDAIELGNPGLDTEVSNNTDLSLSWNQGEHTVDVTVFFNDFSDYINLFNTGTVQEGTEVFAYVQEDARFYGVEVDSRFSLSGPGGAEVGLRVFGDLVRGELRGGDDIPRLPPARIGTRLDWEQNDWTLWSLWVRAGDQDRPGQFEQHTGGYSRWDLGAEYQLGLAQGELQFSLELKNIADEEIRLSTSFLRDIAPEAGRSAVAALRYSF